MKQKHIKNVLKISSVALGVLLCVNGADNTLTLKSKSFMKDQDIRFVKRLDEIQGQKVEGKTQWKSLSKVERALANKDEVVIARSSLKQVVSSVNNSNIAKRAEDNNQKAEAIIKQRLDLKMTEFYNGKLFKNPLVPSQFEGALFMNNGMIESLEATLPNGVSINISYSEMEGNTFKYEMDGKELSGMVYEAAQGTYMLTLANGPYEGGRMKFVGDSAAVLADPNRDIAQIENNEKERDLYPEEEPERDYEREAYDDAYAEGGGQVAQTSKYKQVVDEITEDIDRDEQIQMSDEELQARSENNPSFGHNFKN